MSARDPEAMARSLDRNLRALLLRLADGEPTFDPLFGLEEGKAIIAATRRGLLTRAHQLTSFGREVAESCQPPKWTAAIPPCFTNYAEGVYDRVTLASPDEGELFRSRPIHGRAQPTYLDAGLAAEASRQQANAESELSRLLAHARRIADLLYADDLAAAKRYEVKP